MLKPVTKKPTQFFKRRLNKVMKQHQTQMRCDEMTKRLARHTESENEREMKLNKRNHNLMHQGINNQPEFSTIFNNNIHPRVTYSAQQALLRETCVVYIPKHILSFIVFVILFFFCFFFFQLHLHHHHRHHHHHPSSECEYASKHFKSNIKI